MVLKHPFDPNLCVVAQCSILDSEEGTDPGADIDTDGTPDYQDPDTASPRQAKGPGQIRIQITDGDATTDADGTADGTITDPGGLVTPQSTVSGSGSGGGCFLTTIKDF